MSITKTKAMVQQKQIGFTLIELLGVLAIIAILLALVAPSFQSLLERRRLEGAAETLYADIHYAKSEAVKQSAPIIFDVTTGANWSYQITDAGGTVLKSSAGDTDYTNIQMSAGADVTFTSRQGMPNAAQNYTFRVGASGDTKTIALNVIGRIKMD
jgi:type IV fimbrial biogenesis protein FimT